MPRTLHCYHMEPAPFVPRDILDYVQQPLHLQQATLAIVAESKAAAVRLLSSLDIHGARARQMLPDDDGFWTRFLHAADGTPRVYVMPLNHHGDDLVHEVGLTSCVPVGTLDELSRQAAVA